MKPPNEAKRQPAANAPRPARTDPPPKPPKPPATKRSTSAARSETATPKTTPRTTPAAQPANAGVTPLIREAAEVPEVGAGPVRDVLGASAAPDGAPTLFAADGGPEGLRELAAYIDPLLGIKDPEQQEPTKRLPRMYAEDYAILALLDRVGLALPGMLRRAVMPRRRGAHDEGPHQRQAVPQRPGRPLADRTARCSTRSAALPVLADPLRDGSRTGTPAASDPAHPRVPPDRGREGLKSPPRPAHALLGDRASPAARRPGNGQVAHTALAGRGVRRPADRERPQPPGDHAEGRQATQARRHLRREQQGHRADRTGRDLRDQARSRTA